MNPSNKLLSALVATRSYAKYLPYHQRREILEETINRSMDMYLTRFPKLSREITKAFSKVHALELLPSMRAFQFAGEPVDVNNARSYNCSFLTVTHPRKFSEALFLLLSGTGVGFSVQRHHVRQLPKVQNPRDESRYLVADSIEGWAMAVDALMQAYFYRTPRPLFDFSLIRAKGTRLVTTGSKAPGPEALKLMLGLVEAKLQKAVGRKLSPLEVFDMVCMVSDCVISGGIRRSALICLFDASDKEMLTAKSGTWYEKHGYRARANVSAVFYRDMTTKSDFIDMMRVCRDSNAGEPGVFWTNDPDSNMGTNPCTPGETEILTDRGYARIDTLVGRKVNVWNGFEWSEVEPAVTGYDQDLLAITFSSGQTIRFTPYHEFVVAKDYQGKTERVKAKDLKVGDKLLKHEFPLIEGGEVQDTKEAYTQGFYAGDGTSGHNVIQVYWPKFKCLPYLAVNIAKSSEERVTTHPAFKIREKTFVPLEWAPASRLDCFAGLLDSDGCELKEGGAQIGSVDKAFLLAVQKLLSTLSVHSKVVEGSPEGLKTMPDGRGGSAEFLCQRSYRLCIGSVQMQILKKLGLVTHRLVFNKSPQRDASQFTRIAAIEPAGVADKVYCFTEPKRNLGCFEGIVTGQCAEIALNPNQFCNLTSINLTTVRGEKDFLSRVHSAAFIGTLQASFTDFPYLGTEWRETTEREALLGVSMTGVADVWNAGLLTGDLLTRGAQYAVEVNKLYARKIGINPAARVTTMKPEGSASCVLGSSSGAHARKAQHYIRRFQISKDDALYSYLMNHIPHLIEDYRMAANTAVVAIPQESPKGAILEPDEPALGLLDRVLTLNKSWVHPGHVSGLNRHNVSTTLSIGPDEWDGVIAKMWEAREDYTGLACLPRDGGTYEQAPFEAITEARYKELAASIPELDLREVRETEDNTALQESIACAGGSCEITYLK